MKIKRYRHIYGRKRMPLIYRILITVGVLGILFFVGYSISGPVIDFALGKLSSDPVNDSSSLLSSGGSDSSVTSRSPSSQQAPEVINTGVRGEYITVTAANDTLELDMRLGTNPDKINALIVDVKPREGSLRYDTELEKAQNALNAGERLDAKTFTETLKKAKIKPIAQMSCFTDSTAPYLDDAYGVRYAPDTDWLWVDDSLENGGKPWGNPYSKALWEYLGDIAADLVDKGFETILLDGVCFPTGVALNLTYFEFQTDQTRPAILSEFVSYMNERVTAKGGELMLIVPINAAAGNETAQYGGSVWDVKAPAYAVELDIASLSEPVTIGETTITQSMTGKDEQNRLFTFIKGKAPADVLPVYFGLTERQNGAEDAIYR